MRKNVVSPQAVVVAHFEQLLWKFNCLHLLVNISDCTVRYGVASSLVVARKLLNGQLSWSLHSTIMLRALSVYCLQYKFHAIFPLKLMAYFVFR